MFFTPEQQQTLQAMVDRIIPPDDFPGGWEAGVGEYLFRQFAGDLRTFLPTYREGLDAVEAETRHVFGKRFTELTTEEQDFFLQQADFAGKTLREPVLLQRFCQMLILHASEGYYSDPGNGGNRNRVAWEMIGFHVHDWEAAPNGNL